MDVFAQCLEVFLPSEKYKQANLADRLYAEMLAARTSCPGVYRILLWN